MNNKIKILLIVFTAFIFFNASSTLSGQNDLKIANKLFKANKYCLALPYYDTYLDKFVNKKVYINRGICNYQCNNINKAIEDLNNAAYLGSLDERINLFLAKSYHDKQDFEKAIVYYKKYLADINSNKTERQKIIDNIKKCANGVNLSYKTTDHFIENWGNEINTSFDEILPLQSPGYSNTFYFASNRKYTNTDNGFFKEFQVVNNKGEWNQLLNIFTTPENKNNIFLDFTDNGQKVIFFKGDIPSLGTFYISNYDNLAHQIKLSKKNKFPVNLKSTFAYIQKVNDSTYIFSSNKLGGYGGFDIFITGIRNGKWFKPVNLGGKINSKYDEISPFLTKNGENLFFSSNNLNTIGGFDIFKSSYNYYDEAWSQPENIGMPANSSGDDYGFRLLSSGKGAIYNSNRKDMGFGNQDIYWVYFKNVNDFMNALSSELPFLQNEDLAYIEPIIKEENKTIPNQKPVVEKAQDEVSEQPKASEEGMKNSPVKKDSKVQKNVGFIIPLLLVKNNKFKDENIITDFLDKLAKIMVKYPEIKVRFVGNIFQWKKDSTELFNSLKIVEALGDSLQLRMITPDRIILTGVGDNYPVAKPNGPIRSKNIITKINNHVDVYLNNIDNTPLDIKKENFYISQKLKDPRHKLYETVIEGLTYKVLINKTNYLFVNDKLNNYNDSSIEKELTNNTYFYTIGLYKDYASAKELMEKVNKSGMQGLEIIPYINGIKISKKDILKYAKKYVDLVNFLEDNKNL